MSLCFWPPFDYLILDTRKRSFPFWFELKSLMMSFVVFPVCQSTTSIYDVAGAVESSGSLDAFSFSSIL